MATIKRFYNMGMIERAIILANDKLMVKEREYKNKKNHKSTFLFIEYNTYDMRFSTSISSFIEAIKDDIDSLQTLKRMLQYSGEIEITTKEFNLMTRYKND